MKTLRIRNECGVVIFKVLVEYSPECLPFWISPEHEALGYTVDITEGPSSFTEAPPAENNHG